MAEGDIALVRLMGMQGGQQIQTCWGFQALTGTASRGALAADIDTSILSTFLVGKSSMLVINGIQVDDIVPGTGARVEYTVSPPKAGNDSSSDPLPPKDALVITWNTLTKGRSYRGRTFEAGRTEAGQSNGTFLASTLNLANAFATAMLARYGPAGTSPDWAFGVISTVNEGLTRPTPVLTPVASFAIRSTVYSQRRRTIGQGS